jgi:translation initiation factor eIF-2B subunit delta
MTIKNDNISGASKISSDALLVLKEIILSKKFFSPAKLLENLKKTGSDLINSQPAMASMYNKVNFVLKELEKLISAGKDLNFIKKSLVLSIDELQRKSLDSVRTIGEIGSKLIEDGFTVMTYSFSSTVRSVLFSAQNRGKKFTVIIPEGRPMREGIILATELSRIKINCVLIIDSAISKYISETNLVIMGTDRFTEDSFINKVGTKSLAILCKEFNVPLYCVFESDKYLSKKDFSIVEKIGNPTEIYKSNSKFLKVENFYFEEVERKYLTGFITEKGLNSLNN